MSKKTASELLFEELCGNHQVACREIPRSNRKTADYAVTFAAQPVIVEVKQLEPNAHDLKTLEDFERTGKAQVRGEIGKRVRQEITDSKKQISRLAKGRCPGLLVLYNTSTSLLGAHHTDPMFILTAMYGHLLAKIRLPAQPGGESVIEEMRFGSRRMVTEEHNTSISALCVLYGGQDSLPGITFYHNSFAALPFNPDLFRGPHVRHYKIREAESHRFEDWQEA